MVRFVVAFLLTYIITYKLIVAGADNTFDIGSKAPTFTNLPNASSVGTSKMSLTDFKDKDILVIAITCNHCPVVRAYEDRLIEFVKKYASGKNSQVAFVAINVNNLYFDKFDNMKIRAKQKDFNFPYLYDETQAIARKLHARVTPEFYVFNKDRKLVYWGKMDDSLRLNNVTTHFLRNAVETILRGERLDEPKTRAIGCNVKYELK